MDQMTNFSIIAHDPYASQKCARFFGGLSHFVPESAHIREKFFLGKVSAMLYRDFVCSRFYAHGSLLHHRALP